MAAQLRVSMGAWEAATARAIPRVQCLEVARESAGKKAKHYNTWVLSCAAYPAASGSPDDGTARAWRQFTVRLFPTGTWAPARASSG